MFKKLAGQVPTVVIAAATAAIFGGGGAYAAAQITSAQIADQTIQSRDIGSQGVGTSELRNQSITSGDIAEGGVGRSEIRDGEIRGADLNKDTLATFMEGRAALKQLDENKADWSDDKVGFNEARAGANYTQSIPANSVGVAYGKCSDGKVAISGGFRLGNVQESFNDQTMKFDNAHVIASEPAAWKDGALVNAYQDPAFPQTEGGSFQANAWAVTVQNDAGEPLGVRAWATCVTAN